MTQNILVFAPLAQWAHHVGTELELIEHHLRAGDHVTVMGCLSDVPSCTANMDNSTAGCAKCMSRRLRSLDLLDGGDRLDVCWLRDWLHDADRRDEAEVAVSFSDPHQAASVEIDGWDAGSASASSVISIHRDPEFADPAARDAWEKLIVSGYRARRGVRNWLAAHPETDRTYIFNGRFAMSRGALRACEEAEVAYSVHDRGHDDAHYMLFVDQLPHNLGRFTGLVEAAWERADPDTREATGASFFEREREGRPAHHQSYVTGQQAGLLPDGWDPERRNIVVFNSSEDEFAAIGPEWINPVYESQAIGIGRLADETTNLVGDGGGKPITWWVRMHPNLRNVDNRSVHEIRALADRGVNIIPPDSEVSTYALVDAADLIVTFGSTVGVEATYWRKPSVRIGPALYQDLDVTWSANSHDEAVELAVGCAEPKPVIGALKYGHYIRSFGEPFEYFDAAAGREGLFKGQEVAEPVTPHRFIAQYLAPLASDRPQVYGPAYRASRQVLHRPFAGLGHLWSSRTATKKPVGRS